MWVGQGLFQHRNQQIPLGVGPSDVRAAVDVVSDHLPALVDIGVLAAPGHLEGVGAGKPLGSLIKVDVQILGGVVIAHIDRHIEVHTPHRVHQPHEAPCVDLDIIVLPTSSRRASMPFCAHRPLSL